MKIAVRSRGGVHEFHAVPGEKILHAGLRSGIALPYECGTGTCGTCKAKLIEGEVEDGWPEAPGKASLRHEMGEFLMCQWVARGDCAVEVAVAVTPMASHVTRPAPTAAVIRRSAMLTHDVLTFELELERPLAFEAGQFVLMSTPEVVGARAYSMVNFEPGAERLVLLVKKKPGGTLSEWLFSATRDGSPVGVFGPLGAATFHPDIDKNVLCIAGGSGIAGMMSILARAVRERYFERHAGDVFFGVRTRRDAFYLDELAAFQSAAGGALRVTIALSDENVDPGFAASHSALRFGKGFVHAVAAEGMRGRFDNVRAWAAGPPPMVNATLRMLLLEGKLKPDNIRYDKFS